MKFAQFWTLQAVFVWIISLPAIYILSLPGEKNLSFLVVVGFFLWAVGLLIETTADVQKYRFKNKPTNKGK